MSQPAPLTPGRATPRSSLAGQPAPLGGIWFSAALSGPSEIVCAGPPLSASGPRFGSPFANETGQVESPKLRLWPPSVSDGAAQLPPAFEARSVFCTVSAAASNSPPPVPEAPGVPCAPAPPVPLPPAPAAPPAPVLLATIVSLTTCAAVDI